MKVTIYCMNKGTASQYFALKDAEENQPLPYHPTWKTECDARNWAIKQGQELV